MRALIPLAIYFGMVTAIMFCVLIAHRRNKKRLLQILREKTSRAP